MMQERGKRGVGVEKPGKLRLGGLLKKSKVFNKKLGKTEKDGETVGTKETRRGPAGVRGKKKKSGKGFKGKKKKGAEWTSEKAVGNKKRGKYSQIQIQRNC